MSCILLVGGNVDESRETYSVGILDHIEAVLNNDTVLLLDGHNVRNSTYSDKVGIVLDDTKSGLHTCVTASEFLVRAYELKYHAYACELLEGILTVGTVRVDDSACLGKIETALVVVGDKKIYTYTLSVCNLFICGYTGVNRDYKLCSALLDAVNSTHGNTVSLA